MTAPPSQGPNCPAAPAALTDEQRRMCREAGVRFASRHGKPRRINDWEEWTARQTRAQSRCYSDLYRWCGLEKPVSGWQNLSTNKGLPLEIRREFRKGRDAAWRMMG